MTNTRTMFKSYRVYRGAELLANTDHRLVIAEVALRPKRFTHKPTSTKLNVESLLQDADLASNYNVAITNAFAALGDLPEDEEAAWSTVRDTITSTAKKIVPPKRPQRHPLLSGEALSILDKKKVARLKGNEPDRRRLKGVFKARAKLDVEDYHDRLATQAEEGVRQNNLRPVYRAIR